MAGDYGAVQSGLKPRMLYLEQHLIFLFSHTPTRTHTHVFPRLLRLLFSIKAKTRAYNLHTTLVTSKCSFFVMAKTKPVTSNVIFDTRGETFYFTRTTDYKAQPCWISLSCLFRHSIYITYHFTTYEKLSEPGDATNMQNCVVQL